MAVINYDYDQLKIDKLRHYLETQAEKGQAKPFEIFVDNLKVVAKTEDPKEFDSYDLCMAEDTEKLRILIYKSNLSPRNDQYCFTMQRNKVEKPLTGLGEVENLIQEKLAARDREHEMNRLREELEDAREELEEAEEYAEKLEEEIQHLKNNKYKFGSFNVPELTSLVLEGFVRRNPQMLSKLPMGDVLAGVIEEDNRERAGKQATSATPESNASFVKETGTEITEDEKLYLSYIRELQQRLSLEQIGMYNMILNAIAADPSVMPALLQAIKSKK